MACTRRAGERATRKKNTKAKQHRTDEKTYRKNDATSTQNSGRPGRPALPFAHSRPETRGMTVPRAAVNRKKKKNWPTHPPRKLPWNYGNDLVLHGEFRASAVRNGNSPPPESIISKLFRAKLPMSGAILTPFMCP